MPIPLKSLPEIILALLVGRRRIKIVDPKLQRPADDWNRLPHPTRRPQDPLSAKTDQRDLVAGPT